MTVNRTDPWSYVPAHIDIADLLEAKTFSEEKLAIIRDDLGPKLDEHHGECDILIAGSLSRKEAQQTSDIDGFVLSRAICSENDAKVILGHLRKIATSREVGLRMASEGAFSTVTTINELLTNYGGSKDNNQSLTRRMSVLIEGTGVGKGINNVVVDAKRRILTNYLRDLFVDASRGPVFLINEVIRYYRTIAVDYEFKKEEVGRPWAVRLAKFRHSRKVLYLGALLPLIQSISETKDRVGWLEDQFTNYTPLERILLLLKDYGRKEDWDILKYYNIFVGLFKNKCFREHLDNISFDKRDGDDNYQLIRDNARNLHVSFHNFIKTVDHWQNTLWKYVLS